MGWEQAGWKTLQPLLLPSLWFCAPGDEQLGLDVWRGETPIYLVPVLASPVQP